MSILSAPISIEAPGAAIPCPMCGYDLRGLSEPRCPECGTRYGDFGELTDPDRRLHPYLFEHHPRRNAWSFARTLLAGNLPRRFWRQLRPAQPSRPRRLALYWLICCAMLALVPLTWAVHDSILLHRSNRMALIWEKNFWTGGASGVKPGTTPRSWAELWGQLSARADARRRGVGFASDTDARHILQTYGSFDAYFDQTIPLAPSRRFFAIIFWQGAGRATVSLALCLWPLTMAVTMLIFRQTMRAAKIRPIHLLRVAIYSWDAVAWWGAAMLLIIAWSIVDASRSRWPESLLAPAGRPGVLAVSLMLAAATLVPVVTWRVAVATKCYLNFRHALATAISVQVITMLLVPIELGLLVQLIRTVSGIR